MNHACSSEIFKEDPENTAELNRKVTIVPLGSFYPEVISMPVDPHNAHQTLLLKEKLPLPQKTETSWHPYSEFMGAFLRIMYSCSGQPNHYREEYPTLPPPFQVFQYIARTFLGLRFIDDAFEEYVGAPHKMFVRFPQICGIFLGEWPNLVPGMFEDDPDGDGEYNAYYG